MKLQYKEPKKQSEGIAGKSYTQKWTALLNQDSAKRSGNARTTQCQIPCRNNSQTTRVSSIESCVRRSELM